MYTFLLYEKDKTSRSFRMLITGMILEPFALVTIILCLMIRMVGVYVSVLGTKLNRGERIFSMLAYTPKATVQAAIGAIPLATGLKCGPQVLTVAVLAILFTAPFGAFMIDKYKYLLT